MRKIIKYIYTGLLGLTFVAAAPYVMKQIWESASDVSVTDAAALENIIETMEDMQNKKSIPETGEYLSFGEAITALKNNQKVTRDGWGDDIWIELDTKKDTIQMHISDKQLVAWTISQEDMFAEDWRIITE